MLGKTRRMGVLGWNLRYHVEQRAPQFDGAVCARGRVVNSLGRRREGEDGSDAGGVDVVGFVVKDRRGRTRLGKGNCFVFFVV